MADNEICTEEQIEGMLSRLAVIRERIAAACEESGRKTDDVTLMAVTKTVSPQLINAAVDAGIHVLGENRVQEYLSKRDAYRPQAEVQFIGHLQTNKVRQIIDKVTLIHSVDSVHLAEAVSRSAEAKGIVMPILLEVNIGGELSKSGAAPEEIPGLLRAVKSLSGVRVDGLMTIPPPASEIAEQEAVFSRMKQLYDQIGQEVPLKVLSMGMSGDYEAAIRNGSTLVRIGSALFGSRVYPQKNV